MLLSSCGPQAALQLRLRSPSATGHVFVSRAPLRLYELMPKVEDFADKVLDEFFDRFRKSEHAGLSLAPQFPVKDAEEQAAEDTPAVSSCATLAQRRALQDDSHAFMHNYTMDLQFVFNRVQHHCPKKNSNGFVPLKACRMKSSSKKGRPE